MLDAPDADALAAFSSELLGWPVTRRESDWVLMRSLDGATGLSFRSRPWYEPPVWPEHDGLPTKMLHRDLWGDDLEAAVAHAIAAGATMGAFPPQDDGRVLLDPAGHPFCLLVD